MMLLMAACGGATTGESTSDSVVSNTGSEPVASGPFLPKPSKEDGPAARGTAGITADVAATCLSPQEAELGRMINEYRATKGLPAVQLSKSLTLVAQQHAWDSVNNSNAWPPAPAGQECNMHSWSGNVNPALQQGTWTGVCYTDDHANMNGMHRKPREIAGYPSDGYENSHWASNGVTPASALNGWQNSPGHNAVITEQNGWGPFLALGVGINGNYAHMWVGEVADPAGEAQLCAGAAAQPTTAPPTTAAPTEAAPAAEPTTAAAPTSAPAAEPTTAAAPTSAPAAGPTGAILNATGTISGGEIQHTFEVAQGRRYQVTITPASELDVAAAYSCVTGNSSRSATIDSGWEGEVESFAYEAPANGTCTITVSGYEGSTGNYTVAVVTE